MLKLSMVAVPTTEQRLAAIAQIGVRHLVHYDMANDTRKFDDLEALIAQAARAGLDVPVLESGPPMDRIVPGGEGADEQIEHWVSVLPRLGRLGVKVICYNFMPQLAHDCIVVRTDEEAPTRGGAITTAFRKADLPAGALTAAPQVRETVLRENLARFLRRVLPVAEAAGVKLAMHPDDPPLNPIGGFAHVMSSPADLDWLMEFDASPSNALTLCAGSLGEMGLDPSECARRYRDRIPFVHFRNIRGTIDDFMETWPDDGDLDLPGFISTLLDLGVDSYIRPDHSPRLATERPGTVGYGFDGHVFTLGYMRGLIDAATGRSA
ncbi:MAG TPA: mannonate dehydratase [Bauldia sp.]|nr:mannonate dehydratase [Bauldia sp.]